MRILFAGAAGFIGTNLCLRFLKHGHEVIGIDNLITGTQRNLEELRRFPQFSFVEHDVTRPFKIEGRLDWVLHFASPASPPKFLEYPIETLRANSEGTFQLLELAREKRAGFFYSSTSEIYGDPQVHPQSEGYFGLVNPISPRSAYDEAKRYAEALISSYHRKFRLPIRIIRIFNTYGPFMDPEDGRIISNFINQALSGLPLTIHGDGTQTRSFQYVDDLAEAVSRLLEVEIFTPINIGNPCEHSVLEIASLIKVLTASLSPLDFLPLPVDDPKKRKPDISLAKRVLHWDPAVSLEDGLKKTIAYYQELRGEFPSQERIAISD